MPMCTTGAGPAAALLGGSAGPTVLLNANWLTDTLLTPGSDPVGNGDPVESWAMATGGPFNYGLAASAGAAVNPVYVTASGVHTAAGSAALTCATPVTIPADTDFVAYFKVKVPDLSTDGPMRVMGRAAELGQVYFGSFGMSFTNSSDLGAYWNTAVLGAGTHLVRISRASGVFSMARTGVGAAAPSSADLTTESIVFDTLLATNTGGGGVLDAFSATGNYIQKIYIYHGSSTPDTAYETANGGIL